MMMRVLRAAMAASMLAAAVACEDDSPNSPSDTVVFAATLSPASENPPVSNAERVGSGTATIQMVVNRDSSNAITSAVVHFSVSLTGFPEGTRINISHIHRGATGVNGPIVVNTDLVSGEIAPLGASGGVNYVKLSKVATPAIATEILANPANFYFNVHSTLNPGGVARGQLVQQ